jgi:hypothetical protein
MIQIPRDFELTQNSASWNNPCTQVTIITNVPLLIIYHSNACATVMPSCGFFHANTINILKIAIQQLWTAPGIFT